MAKLFSINNDVILYVRNREQADQIIKTNENQKYLPGHKLNKKILITNNINLLNQASIIVVAVPSTHFRESLLGLSFLDPRIPFISVTKGLEKDTHLRMSEVILDALVNKTHDDIAVISGPNLAAEIMENKPAATVVASKNKVLAQNIQKKLVSEKFRVYTSDDIIGCEISGIAKNVIAIAVGIGAGAEYGDNAKALVITRGLAEIKRLGSALGGKSETFSGLAGIGDLIATCSSDLSSNRTVGFMLGQGNTLDEILKKSNHVAEGVNSAKSLSELANSFGVSMPIVDAIEKVINEGKVTEKAVAALMTRPATVE